VPFNGSNTFTVVNVFVPGTTILSSAVNTNFTDIATGLSDCVTRDAQGAVTGNLLFSSTAFLGLPSGTTAQRPVSASAGYFRFNSTIVTPEFFDGTNWDALASTIIQPQGYLTLTNLAGGGPIISADVIAATSVYYSPYIGQLCPIYNGTNFVNQIFTEQTLTLAAQHTANTIFDVFAFLNSGVFTIATGPAWTISTAGSGARGTGAGTTQLQRLNGIWTNQQSLTARNGSTTYTIAVNQGTYLGSFYTDGTAGQVTCHRAFGQNRKFGVWNANNRVPILLSAGDPTATWTYQTALNRASNNTPAAYASNTFNVGGSAANGINVLCGLAEEEVDVNFTQLLTIAASSAIGTSVVFIGVNSVTVASGLNGQFSLNNPAVSTTDSTMTTASYQAPPSLGLNIYTSIERVPSAAAASNTFNGTSSLMLLKAVYRG
jgi:hypothetical protein